LSNVGLVLPLIVGFTTSTKLLFSSYTILSVLIGFIYSFWYYWIKWLSFWVL